MPLNVAPTLTSAPVDFSNNTAKSKIISQRQARTMLKTIKQLVGMVGDLGHDGIPPSWSGKCSKCTVIAEIKKTYKLE